LAGLLALVTFCTGMLPAVGPPEGQPGQAASIAQGAQAGSPDPAQLRVVVNKYCVTCHNERLKTAGLLLDQADIANVSTGTPTWEKVIRKLHSGAMPPVSAPRPEPAVINSLTRYLETSIDSAAAAKPEPGRPALHRLNRAEYVNAIRDLLALEIKPEDLLPADESTAGFDNVAEGLTVSPRLLERYVSAAEEVARMAIGDKTAQPLVEIFDVPRYLMQDDRMSEDLPFGTRGGIAFKYHFPLSGTYSVKIRLQRDFRDRIRGLGEAHQLDVRVDGAKVKSFSVGGLRLGRSAPVFSTAGQGDPEQEHYELTADDALEGRFEAQAGAHLVQVAFARQFVVPEGALQYVNAKPAALPRLIPYDYAEYKGGDPTVHSVAIGGPFSAKGVGETASRQKIFICRPAGRQDEEPCANKILSTLARRAYRRPIRQDDMAPLLGFYRTAGAKGGFEAGIAAALERILVGPEFLFRIERDPPGTEPDTAYRLSDLELASRLSFFLWSSIPDDELLSIAESGKLTEPTILAQQVRRMLADARAKALITNFTSEWLYLRNIPSARPDPDVFPQFDENLREAMRTETELFVESIIHEDRRVTDLLDANYSYLNERLARHYGIPDVYGSHFRRVSLPAEQRGGILGHAGILMVTSYANRTAPTIRGNWVLENILASPPPPPPPNVPSLAENRATRDMSMRQRLEQHRANPVCATCHAQMDPLGFALENFDAIGKWRTADGKAKIDPSGTLPNGTAIDGPAGLRKMLLGKQNEFLHALTEKLLTYAVGRPVEYYDQPAIRRIVAESAAGENRWSALVTAVANSAPFQMRRSQQP
jgi:mono/diheme cytochrome c family protein